MSYSILYIRHSGPSLLGSSNATSEYGRPIVAATAISTGRFVCLGEGRRYLWPASLSLPARGAKQPGAATRAGVQNGFHGQSTSAADPGGASPLSAAAPTDQP